MKKLIAIFAILALTTPAFAGVNRILDGTAITAGSPSNVLTLPQTTDTVVGRATTDTLTNKSISGGSNTFSNIPVSAIATGTGLSVSSGGTGDTSLTSNGLLFGNGTSAVGITSAGSQFQVFQAGSGGVPTVGALNLGQSAAVTGTLPVGNGGTGQATLSAHDVLVGNGTSGVTQVAPSTSGFVLTSNGGSADPSFQAPPSGMPSLNGGSASPQSVTASGGVTLASLSYDNFAWLIGSPGAVTVTATPSVTACTADGQKLHLIGTDVTKTVTLQDNAGLSGSDLELNGTWVGGLFSVLNLHCDMTLLSGVGVWVEDSRR